MAHTNNALLITLVLYLLLLQDLSSVVVANADDEHKALNTPPSVPMVPDEARKFGRHQQNSASPSQAPEGGKVADDHPEHHSSSSSETTSINEHEHEEDHEQDPSHEDRHDREGHHPEHHVDKSVAAGGIIIAGLAAAFVLSIFCYIRATRRTRQQMIVSKEQLI